MNETGGLAVRLAEASGEELLELVEANLMKIDQNSARQTLKNPHVTREVVELLASHKGLVTSRELRRELVAHRLMPEPLALRMVSTLFWRDLLALVVETRVRPTVRRAAERNLTGRLSAMSAGERMSIARRASPGVIAELRRDPDRRVIQALLDNPRMTEGALAPLVASEAARPDVLEAIISHRRWGQRYTVRAQFCRNPRSPTGRVLREMSMLRKIDLRQLTSDPRLAAAVRKRAELLLGRGGGG